MIAVAEDSGPGEIWITEAVVDLDGAVPTITLFGQFCGEPVVLLGNLPYSISGRVGRSAATKPTQTPDANGAPRDCLDAPTNPASDDPPDDGPTSER